MVSPFEFHTSLTGEPKGVEQWVMTCPFCEKEEHFFYGPGPAWFWDCKVCMRSGNLIEFLRQWYDDFQNITKTAHFVSELRGLPVSAISALGLKFNETNNSIFIPTFRNGKVSNLYKAVEQYNRDKGHMQWNIMCTPGMDHKLFNYQEVYEDTIWVCEGHWDKIAGDAIVGSTKGISCIGVPGAGIWDQEWTKLLAEKDIVFCYDNDPSGRQGFERVILQFIAKAPQKPKSISFIDWPENAAKGFDLNDAYRLWGKGTYGKLKELIKPFTVPEGTVIVKKTVETVEADMSCDTFDKLMEEFRKVYYTTLDMEQALAMVIASIISVRYEGEQLWIRLIGPPGSGKTSIAKTVSGSEQVVLKSTFTGLFSGWIDDKDEDASLVPKIAGRTLIVKDADALLRQPNVEKIFSQLRDFYDKDSSVHYNNRKSLDYQGIKSTMVLCGTNVLRRSDSAFLGERFLDFELRLTTDDRNKVSEKMADKSHEMLVSGSAITPDVPVIAAAKGLLRHLWEKPLNIQYPTTTRALVIQLADLAAKMRSKVDREQYGQREITFSPVVESPTRLIGQLDKLCHMLPIVFGENTVTDRTHKVLFKCVRDIIDPSSVRYRLCLELLEGWYSRDKLVEITGISRSTVTRELDNLRALKMVREEYGEGSGPGRKLLKFTLTDDLKEGILLLDEK